MAHGAVALATTLVHGVVACVTALVHAVACDISFVQRNACSSACTTDLCPTFAAPDTAEAARRVLPTAACDTTRVLPTAACDTTRVPPTAAFRNDPVLPAAACATAATCERGEVNVEPVAAAST